ncbi:MAG: HD domain-containing protein [Desulfovibrionaceae bacterium]|nr:HD domain-containing protein [Desulfovibrionaceae bacterium]
MNSDEKTPPLAPSSCFPISPYYLLPSCRGGFSVYLKQHNKLVLYAKKGELLSKEHRNRLGDLGVREIYVKLEEQQDYRDYVHRNLGQILADESIPIRERSRAWYDTSVDMAKEVFDHSLPEPMTKSRFNRIRALISASANFFADPASLKELSAFISKGYDIYNHCLAVMVFTANVLNSYRQVDEKILVAASMGAMLHDIGKIRLPREVLEKDPATFDQDETAQYRTHPAVGVSICCTLPLPLETLHSILFHHETEDGSGFPSRAKGEYIPFYVKVLSLCNQFDGLTRNTPYREALSPYDALQFIKAQKGAYNVNILKRLILTLSKADIT